MSEMAEITAEDMRAALEQLMPELLTIPKSQIRTSVMPIETYSLEAMELADHVENDAVILRRLRIDGEHEADELRLGAMALAVAEILWDKSREIGKLTTEEWVELKSEAYETRGELIDFVEFICEELGLDHALETIGEIREGSGDDDMIADIGKIVFLLQEYLEQFNDYGIDQAQVDSLQQLFKDLMRLSGASDADEKRPFSEKDIRDRAYTWLEKRVRRLRKAGKVLFRKSEQDLARYRSEYEHRRGLGRSR